MENKLTRYYRSALSRCVWLIALFGVGVNLLVGWASRTWGTDNWGTHLVEGLLSSGAIAGLFLFAERQIRTRLWKLAYPELDLDGTWSGATTYERQHISSTGSTSDPSFAPFERANNVLLVQNCLTIAVKASIAPNKKGNWHSLASQIVDSETGPSVRYAYYVDYGGASGFPSEVIGYETLSVVNPTPGVRPEMLSGSFAHCARGQAPVFSGSVAFFRSQEPKEPAKAEKFARWVGTRIAKLGKPKVE
jgi:hypothetical protein